MRLAPSRGVEPGVWTTSAYRNDGRRTTDDGRRTCLRRTTALAPMPGGWRSVPGHHLSEHVMVGFCSVNGSTRPQWGSTVSVGRQRSPKAVSVRDTGSLGVGTRRHSTRGVGDHTESLMEVDTSRSLKAVSHSAGRTDQSAGFGGGRCGRSSRESRAASGDWKASTFTSPVRSMAKMCEATSRTSRRTGTTAPLREGSP
jgi:hypothetical protein